MSLVTSSPLIGSWADQPLDERQVKLIEQHQAARAAAAQAQARRQPEKNTPLLPMPANAPVTLLGHTNGTVDEGPTPPPLVHGPSDALSDSLGRPYGPYYLNPNRVMSASFLALMPTPPPSDSNFGPAGGWSLAGKLKEMARSIFERAYGLNGRAMEPHEALCEEVMLATGCSRKSFCECVYGHSYASELTDLRSLVPGYRPKERRKRDASERGGSAARKGKMQEAANEHAHVQQHQNGSIGGVSRTLVNGSIHAHQQYHLQPIHPSSNGGSPSKSTQPPPPPQQQSQSSNLNTFLSRVTPPNSHASNVVATIQPILPSTQQYFHGQPVQLNPTIHLTHRLIPTSQNLQPVTALHTYQAHHTANAYAAPQQQLHQQQAQQVHSQPQPQPQSHPHPPSHASLHQMSSSSSAVPPSLSSRFAPPPITTPRKPSPAASPQITPIVQVSPPVTSMQQRRSVDATNAIIAAVAAANSVSPHLASLGDPSKNPILPIVPSSPNLSPATGASLKAQPSAAKVVGSPLRQGTNPMAGANLPPRPNTATRNSITHPPGFQFSQPIISPHASPIHMPMRAPQVMSPEPVIVPFTPPPSEAETRAAIQLAAAKQANTTPIAADEAEKALAAAQIAAHNATPPKPEASKVADANAAVTPTATAAIANAAAHDKNATPSPSPLPNPTPVNGHASVIVIPSVHVSPVAPKSLGSFDDGIATVTEEDEDEDEDSPDPPSTPVHGKKKKNQAKKNAKESDKTSVATLGKKKAARLSSTPPSSPLRSRKQDATVDTPVEPILAVPSTPPHPPSASSPSSSLPSSSPTSVVQLFLLTLVGSSLFMVTRSYVGQVLYDSSSASSNSHIWSLIGGVFIGSIFIYMWLFRSAYDAHQQWSTLVLELSNQLEKYVTTWEMLAVDQSESNDLQLLAALHQIQTLLDASLASFTGLSSATDKSHAVAALEHAVQTMDFLHLAHRNLIFELGSTQPIMRLVASLGVVRSKLMEVRSKTTSGTTIVENPITKQQTTIANTSAVTMLIVGLTALNMFALLFAPPLPSMVLDLAVPLVCVSILGVILLVVWSAQYPFMSGDPTSHNPAGLLGIIGVSLLVSLEPLQYLRVRLSHKAAQTQERIDHPDMHPTHTHGPHTHGEDEEDFDAEDAE